MDKTTTVSEGEGVILQWNWDSNEGHVALVLMDDGTFRTKTCDQIIVIWEEEE